MKEGDGWKRERVVPFYLRVRGDFVMGASPHEPVGAE